TRIYVPAWALGVWTAAYGKPVTMRTALGEWWMYVQLPAGRRQAYRRAAYVLKNSSRTRANLLRVAKILDQAAFRDLSVRLLLQHRLVNEAAGLHLKHGARRLAASLYAKNGQWKKAGALYLQE